MLFAVFIFWGVKEAEAVMEGATTAAEAETTTAGISNPCPSLPPWFSWAQDWLSSPCAAKRRWSRNGSKAELRFPLRSGSDEGSGPNRSGRALQGTLEEGSLSLGPSFSSARRLCVRGIHEGVRVIFLTRRTRPRLNTSFSPGWKRARSRSTPREEPSFPFPKDR